MSAMVQGGHVPKRLTVEHGPYAMRKNQFDMNAALLGLYSAYCRGGNGFGLERILPAGRTRFYGYGRQALAEAFRLARITEGDEVLLPGFLCGEALASLSVVGAVSRFYQVDESLHAEVASWESVGFKNVRAVVAVNYFGFPQPLDPIREWCRAHNATLIEDNAHGFLSENGGMPLGRRGDFGVFSLRKTLSLPNGAALVDNRHDEIARDGLSFDGSCRHAEWRYRAKVTLKRLIEWSGYRGARIVLGGIRMLRLAATGSRLPIPPNDRETAIPQEAPSSLSERLLRRCDVSSERQRRRGLYRLCRELFDGVPGVRPVFGTLPDGVVPQGFPFFYTRDDRRYFISTWWKRGVPILTWPDHLPTALESDAPDHYRQVLIVPFLW